MKYCPMCGCTVEDTAAFCSKCGATLNTQTQNGYQTYTGNTGTYATPASQDTGNMGWGVLGFFVPIAGLILYLCWMDERPKDARIAGKGALISVIVGVALSVIFGIIYAVLLAAMFVSY